MNAFASVFLAFASASFCASRAWCVARRASALVNRIRVRVRVRARVKVRVRVRVRVRVGVGVRVGIRVRVRVAVGFVQDKG